MSTKSTPRILGVEQLSSDAKWLKLEKIKWQDEDGEERVWEAANRSTRSKGGVDSVHILALLHRPFKPVSTILIEQYRPPVAATVIELPAGLVDEGEDVSTAALRELHEETGYGNGKQGQGVEVEDVSSVLVKDPGMSGANMNLVTINIRLGKDDPEPEQHLDPGEHIVKRLVPLKDLDNTLREYSRKGFAVDALVASIATGYRLAGKIGH